MQSNGHSSLLDFNSSQQDPTRPSKGEPLVHQPRSRHSERYAPPSLQSFADLGLPANVIEQLIFKFLYFRGDMLATDLSTAMGMKFSIIQPMLEAFRAQQLLQVKSSFGLGSISSVFALTDSGRGLAREYLENNHYIGPAPVPVSQYAVAVQAQKMPTNWLRPERLAKAYAGMVTSREMLDQIGPAVSSGKSLLIYGQPGNGKTHAAEALGRIQTTDIYVPYALEYQGCVIQLFDPNYHRLAETADKDQDYDSDRRWVRCRRPFIVSGGELSVSMLDLSFNTLSKIYDAPLQLKGNNGIYLIDDFGRQMSSPAQILNRWIVPMDRRVDYLSLSNGGKVAVPFESFLVFSTNLNPSELGDEAFLRRIQYKMLLRSPEETEFCTIFQSCCEAHNLPMQPELIARFIDRHYKSTGKAFRRCHPRDLISQVVDRIHFASLPRELTDELLDRAFEGCFLQSTESD